MEEHDVFKGASNKFLEWFCSQPGTSFHPSLQITDLRSRGAGRGVIATQEIPSETDLFSIPRSIVISEETSDIVKKLPELFRLDADQNGVRDHESAGETAVTELPTSWLNLILILLYESFHQHSSSWSTYISVLPQEPASFNTLMFWSQPELAQLQTSAMASKIGKGSADEMFKKHILPVVKEYGDVFYGSSKTLSDEDLLQKCHVIGSLIMSYAFDLQPDEDENNDQGDEDNEDGWVEDRSKPPMMGMVPMADMLNADAEFNAHLSHGENLLTMTSLRDIKAGEEVLNYYGPLPNGELLRRYGYTSSKHSRYDVVEISWELVKQVLHDISSWQQGPTTTTSNQVNNIIAEVESDEDNTDILEGFILEREAGDPNEQGLCPMEAKFAKFPDELVSIVSGIAEKVTKGEVQKRRLNSEAEKNLIKSTTLNILACTLKKRLEGYSTTVSEDEEALQNKDAKGRLKLAVDVRLGEKRLLQEALDWTEYMRQKYRHTLQTLVGDDESAGQNPKKKQKRHR